MSDDDKPQPLKSPYSDAILRLVSQIKEAKTSEERANMMMVLASQFTNEHDATDAGLDEIYHEFFEEYQEARLRFQQAAIRLGRLAMHEVQGYFDENNLPLPIPKSNTLAN
jgi:hypothetical protein